MSDPQSCEHCGRPSVDYALRVCDHCRCGMCSTCEDIHDDQAMCPLKALLQSSGLRTPREYADAAEQADIDSRASDEHQDFGAWGALRIVALFAGGILEHVGIRMQTAAMRGLRRPGGL